MDKNKRNKLITVVAVMIFLILSAIYAIINSAKRDQALQKNVLVIATITNMYNSRGPTTVEVQFKYNNKIIKGSFGTYQWDSIAVKDKIRILVSEQFPDKYIKYVGLAK
jgi:type II secretory pathway pseudopilin PulG